ncbi:hypothetical protein [Microseira wollei]|uniref:hypothetical protein n=1 Tax=Microseira wollei TaxID=467598 RepID=UPI001CFD1098|nr:hypothetical protein [Microseira wollei]
MYSTQDAIANEIILEEDAISELLTSLPAGCNNYAKLPIFPKKYRNKPTPKKNDYGEGKDRRRNRNKG